MLWLGQNSLRLLEGLLAAAKLGGVFCPVNWRQSPEELAFVIDDVDPVVVRLAGRRDRRHRPRPARDRVDDRRCWLRHDAEHRRSATAYEAFSRPAPTTIPTLDVDPRPTPVLMLYTAAFAGRPNGALLSHTACIAPGLVMATLLGRRPGTTCT